MKPEILRRTSLVFLACLACAGASAYAEDGYRLWLRYDLVSD